MWFLSESPIPPFFLRLEMCPGQTLIWLQHHSSCSVASLAVSIFVLSDSAASSLGCPSTFNLPFHLYYFPPFCLNVSSPAYVLRRKVKKLKVWNLMPKEPVSSCSVVQSGLKYLYPGLYHRAWKGKTGRYVFSFHSFWQMPVNTLG